MVDKDAASALLATALQADVLLLLTDSDALYDPVAWERGEQVPLASPVCASQLEGMAFAAGSMGPKVAAAMAFVSSGDGRRVAGIGALRDAAAIAAGRAGTLIVPG